MIGFISPDGIMINVRSHDMKKITGAQIRAARSLVRLSAAELAARAKVGIATVRRAEVEDGEIGSTAANADAIRRALESAGVEFISENDGGAGVRLAKPAGE